MLEVLQRLWFEVCWIGIYTVCVHKTENSPYHLHPDLSLLPNGVSQAQIANTLLSECYCSRYLSVFSVPVPESECDLACLGNSSQICGGALRLSLYEARKDAKGLAPTGRGEVKSKAVLALGVAFIALMVIC